MLKCKLIPPSDRSPFWRIRGGTYPVTGKRIDTTTGTTQKREADAIFEQFQRDLLNGVLGRPTKSFADAAFSYIEARQPKGSQRAAIVGTVRKTDGEISPCLVLDFGDGDCRTIDQAAVNETVRRRFTTTRHGRSYKPGTIVRDLIQPLTAVLNYAHRQDWCDEPHFTRPKFNDKRNEYATIDQANRLLRAAAPHSRQWYLFPMLEGSRVSETLDLDWPDVQLNDSWAVLRDTKRNGEARGIALHPQIVEMLRAVPVAKPKGRVFKTDDGVGYAESEGGGRGKTGWNRTCRRAGISNLHLHDIRHTFATIALLSSMMPRLQRQQMGHEVDDMYGRYAHVPRDELVRAVARLPWLEYQDITYLEWVRSGFGRYILPAEETGEVGEGSMVLNIRQRSG
jgi:integrase